MFLIAEIVTREGETVGVLTLAPKQFKTGRTGFFATGKVELAGVRYQAQIQLVAIEGRREAVEKST